MNQFIQKTYDKEGDAGFSNLNGYCKDVSTVKLIHNKKREGHEDLKKEYSNANGGKNLLVLKDLEDEDVISSSSKQQKKKKKKKKK